jgi:hypothetical protein
MSLRLRAISGAESRRVHRNAPRSPRWEGSRGHEYHPQECERHAQRLSPGSEVPRSAENGVGPIGKGGWRCSDAAGGADSGNDSAWSDGEEEVGAGTDGDGDGDGISIDSAARHAGHPHQRRPPTPARATHAGAGHPHRRRPPTVTLAPTLANYNYGGLPNGRSARRPPDSHIDGCLRARRHRQRSLLL